MFRRILLILFACLTVSLAACSVPTGGRVIGGQPFDISELPTYPQSVELNAGESKIIAPLFEAAQLEPAPFIGLGIEVNKKQRTFRMPNDTTFDAVKAFYADKLQSEGWREDPAMRVFLTQLNKTSPQLQGGIWIRIDQTLLIILATDPATGNKELTLSLATH